MGKVWKPVVGLVAGMAALAACSPPGDDAGSSGGDTIVVGMICSCSGIFAATSGASDDVGNAWASAVNEAGGINGHKVKLIIKDDGSDPVKGLRAAKELIEQDNVVAIVGAQSTTDSAWASYVSGKEIPVVGGAPGGKVLNSSPSWYPVGSGLEAEYAAALQQIKTDGHKKAGFLYCAEAPSCKDAANMLDSFATQVDIGMESVVVSGGETSYAAPCLVMKNAGVDGLILGLGGDTAAKVAANCAQQGFTPALYGVNAAYTPQLAASPAFNGMRFLSGNVNFFDASIPGVAAFQQAMAKYSPQVDLAQMSYFSFYAWLAGELFEAAGEAGDIGPDSTPDDVRKGLYALDGETLNGTAPPLTFSPDSPTVITCNFLLELQNGKLISGAGGQLTCLPPELGQEVTTIATAA